MALFSFRHSTKTFSEKVTQQHRRARHGQTAAHLRYITRRKAASIVLSERLPTTSLSKLAKQVELDADKRNGRVCERFIVALPVECSADQRVALVRAFCDHMTKGKTGYIAAVHDLYGNDVTNPHFHAALFDKFIQSGGRGRPRSVLGMARKNAVENAARDWAKIHNRLLLEWGYSSSSMIDHRSYFKQGVERIPTIHVGSGAKHLNRKGKLLKTKPEWRHVDAGHFRTEANKVINEINNLNGQLNDKQRNNRLASGDEIHRSSSDNIGATHREDAPWAVRGLGTSAKTGARSQQNQSGYCQNQRRPDDKCNGHFKRAECDGTRSAPPFLKNEDGTGFIRCRKPHRRIFVELMMLRDRLRLQFNRMQMLKDSSRETGAGVETTPLDLGTNAKSNRDHLTLGLSRKKQPDQEQGKIKITQPRSR